MTERIKATLKDELMELGAMRGQPDRERRREIAVRAAQPRWARVGDDETPNPNPETPHAR